MNVPTAQLDERALERTVQTEQSIRACVESRSEAPPSPDAAGATRWRSAILRAYHAQRSMQSPLLARYYRSRTRKRLARLVRPGSRVLDVGCGTGELLEQLQPSVGVGVDIRPDAIAEARRCFPQYRYHELPAEQIGQLGDTFDYIIIHQALGEFYDLRSVFGALQTVCHARTRVIIVHYSRVWQPAIRLAEWLRIKPAGPPQNWVPSDETRHLLSLSGFETISCTGMTIAPLYVPLLSNFLNRFVGNLPGIQHLGLNYVLVARSVDPSVLEADKPRSASIVVPARNEAGHIRDLLRRIPRFAPRQEVLFVEGNSTDDTWAQIHDAARNYKGPFKVTCRKQTGIGKRNAVEEGLAEATGDVLMILDADISVPPEELPAFYDTLVSGRGEFINGSRLVYPMEQEAMRFLNLVGNKFFGWVFTYLLQQRFRDTLCGTKVLLRSDYEKLVADRRKLQSPDPFGDFDWLFGAARLNLKIVDLPVHYAARTYGETNISRFRHGWVLLRMCLFAARTIRFV